MAIINPNPITIPHRGVVDEDFVSQLIATFSPLIVPTNLITASGAVDPHTANFYFITDASVAALTIAAPTAGAPSAGGDDGKTIEIYSTTSAQHTLTFTGGTLQSGGTGVTTATWPAHAGASLSIVAYGGKWVLASNNLVVIS